MGYGQSYNFTMEKKNTFRKKFLVQPSVRESFAENDKIQEILWLVLCRCQSNTDTQMTV